MTNTPQEPDVNDAATDAIVARARRVSAISLLIMFLGVGAVLAVIVYRLMTVPPAGPLMSGTIPAEGRVISAVAADNRLTVTHERDGGALVVIYDLRTLKETHRVVVGGPQVPRP